MHDARTIDSRRVVLGAALVAVSLLMIAQIAWACTAQPRIINLIPLSAPAGQTVVVSGQGVTPEVAPQDVGTSRQTGLVEIRWNSVGGPSLATARVDAQGNFSTQVVVPQAPPGIYTVVVAAGESGIARAALEVTAPSRVPASDASAGSRESTDLWRGFDSQLTNEAPFAKAVSDDPGFARNAGIAMIVAGGIALAGALAAVGSRKKSRA